MVRYKGKENIDMVSFPTEETKKKYTHTKKRNPKRI